MKRSKLMSIFSLSAALFAASAAQADGYTTTLAIDDLEIVNDEYVVWTMGVTNNATNNPASCSAGVGKYYFHTPSITSAQRDLMTRTLLGAFLAGRKVELYVKTGAGACVNNYPSFHRVSMSHEN